MGGRGHRRRHWGDMGAWEERRRRGIICNVATLGTGQPWPGDIWQVRLLATAQAPGSGPRPSAACCCVSLCCVVLCLLLCSVRQQRAGGRWRQNTVAASPVPWPPPDQAWSPHRQHQPPHTSCQLPQLPRPRLVAATPPAAARWAGGCWVVSVRRLEECGTVHAACLLIRPRSRPPLAAVWLCPVSSARCSLQCVPVYSQTWDHGLVQGAVQCEQGSR